MGKHPERIECRPVMPKPRYSKEELRQTDGSWMPIFSGRRARPVRSADGLRDSDLSSPEELDS
eukprot:8281004-Pyramimonas_sp.AAC.1